MGRCGRRRYSGSNQSLRERPRRPSRAGSLGSSGPGGGGLARAHHTKSAGLKRRPALRSLRRYLDGGGCNALPERKHDYPQPWGKRVGGVSGEPMGVHEEERSSHVLRSQRWKALRFATRSSAFAGGRYRANLGRSGRMQRARSSVFVRTGDKECPLDARGGERRQRAIKRHALFSRVAQQALSRFEDTSFAHSRDPRNVSHGIAHAGISLSRSGKLTQVRGTGTGGERTGRNKMRGSPHSADLERDLARNVRKGRWSRPSSP